MARQGAIKIGGANFHDLVLRSPCFVDKTELLELIMSDGVVTLITRPRRFGKTMNLSMIHDFFQFKTSESPKVNVFEHCLIGKSKEFCKVHQEKYAVFHFDFKTVAGANINALLGSLILAIRRVLEIHVMNIRENFPGKPEQDFLDVKVSKLQGPDVNLYDLGYVAEGLMQLYKLVGIRSIVLLDEYDTPYQKGYSLNVSDELIAPLNAFLVELFKSKYLFRGVIAGITVLPKESLFSSLNNVIISSVLSDDVYSSHFGFTPEEVETLVKNSGTNVKPEVLYEWYKGYHFGSATLFNPWSILSCIYHKKAGYYWTESGGADFIQDLITSAGIYIKSHFDALLNDKCITKHVENHLACSTLKTSEESFWTLLVHTGYLNAIAVVGSKSMKSEYKLSIPNKEIKDYFQKLVGKIFESSEYNKILDDFIKYLLEGKTNLKLGVLGSALFNSPTSFFHFPKQSDLESYLVFLSGLMLKVSGTYKVTYQTGEVFGFTLLEPYDTSKSRVVVYCDLGKNDGITDKDKQNYCDKDSSILQALQSEFGKKTIGIAITLTEINNVVKLDVNEIWSHVKEFLNHIPPKKSE